MTNLFCCVASTKRRLLFSWLDTDGVYMYHERSQTRRTGEPTTSVCLCSVWLKGTADGESLGRTRTRLLKSGNTQKSLHCHFTLTGDWEDNRGGVCVREEEFWAFIKRSRVIFRPCYLPTLPSFLWWCHRKQQKKNRFERNTERFCAYCKTITRSQCPL